MLEHSDILEIVLNIRNPKLRKAILLKKNIDYEFAANVFFKDLKSDTKFEEGEVVVLRVEAAMQLPVKLFKVEMVREAFQLKNVTKSGKSPQFP